MRRFTKNFGVDELACHDGSPVPLEYYENAEEICRRAQVLRDFIAGPLKVMSGYRTPSWNTKCGGVDKSKHLTASALDLKSFHYSSGQLALYWQGLVNIGAIPDGGLGIYDTFIHVDTGRSRRWAR